MNYLTKKHLSRRTLLRGSGVALALRDGSRIDVAGGYATRVCAKHAALAPRVHLHSSRRGAGAVGAGGDRARCRT